jgi:hypothetical protein
MNRSHLASLAVLSVFAVLALGSSSKSKSRDADASAATTASTASAAAPEAKAAAPASLGAFKPIALTKDLKGLSVDAPEGATIDPDDGTVLAGEKFKLVISKDKVDLAEQKKSNARDLKDVKIVLDEPTAIIYAHKLGGIVTKHGFRANVKVGKKDYSCMENIGMFDLPDVEAMLKSCRSLAATKK